ncbi:uncharacterized protein MONBRDRAFT_31692 [Monosiga brevicollis MX1]|uniref:MutL C-terminal dimerisation domain-containing protein n=1 Tax=Monosiga brevicollis TaxID=81824 RepID=A9UV76_MONBE|nr:uncharacterized protein MONBRDRAFT_31692 [Monosiga brevicollis MX1]EDQ90847.1 predicted protein [Monosiga brevicollis MX1]|eukprot:XP_001744144.1 hypothetical protein [Monosiga brevicollis MX1]
MGTPGKVRPLPADLAARLGDAYVLSDVTVLVAELLANALDAGATRVVVHTALDEALVVVRDNGHGLRHDDLQLLGQAVASSKLPTTAQAQTHGFRGQALRAIAQCCCLSIKSRDPQSGLLFQKVVIALTWTFGRNEAVPRWCLPAHTSALDRFRAVLPAALRATVIAMDEPGARHLRAAFATEGHPTQAYQFLSVNGHPQTQGQALEAVRSTFAHSLFGRQDEKNDSGKLRSRRPRYYPVFALWVEMADFSADNLVDNKHRFLMDPDSPELAQITSLTRRFLEQQGFLAVMPPLFTAPASTDIPAQLESSPKRPKRSPFHSFRSASSSAAQSGLTAEPKQDAPTVDHDLLHSSASPTPTGHALHLAPEPGIEAGPAQIMSQVPDNQLQACRHGLQARRENQEIQTTQATQEAMGPGPHSNDALIQVKIRTPDSGNLPSSASNTPQPRFLNLPKLPRGALQNIRLNNEHLHQTRVVGQLDAKFLCCTVPIPDGRLLYVIDQHAAHERIMLEQFLANDTQTGDRGLQQPITIPLAEPLSVEMVPWPFHSTAWLNMYGKCMKQYQCCGNWLNEWTSTMLTGELGLLPSLRDMICTRACRAAIKFGDQLTLNPQPSIFSFFPPVVLSSSLPLCAMSVVTTILCLLLTVMFLMAGTAKLTDAFVPDLHNELVGKFETYAKVLQTVQYGVSGSTFRQFLGVVETAAALLLWVAPQLAASVLAIIMTGAIYTHLLVEDPPQAMAMPAVLLLFSVIVAVSGRKAKGSGKSKKN